MAPTCACKNVENIGLWPVLSFEPGPEPSITDEARMPLRNSEACDPPRDKIERFETGATVGIFRMTVLKIGGISRGVR